MMRPAPRLPRGFTLLEGLFALLLLGVCLIPATYALRDAVAAPAGNALAARNLDCVGTLMETVLATPYDQLFALATSNGPSAYPVPVDPNCPARQVTIQRYGNDGNRQLGPSATPSAYLLYVSVALANASDGNPFTLTTLVAR